MGARGNTSLIALLLVIALSAAAYPIALSTHYTHPSYATTSSTASVNTSVYESKAIRFLISIAEDAILRLQHVITALESKGVNVSVAAELLNDARTYLLRAIDSYKHNDLASAYSYIKLCLSYVAKAWRSVRSSISAYPSIEATLLYRHAKALYRLTNIALGFALHIRNVSVRKHVMELVLKARELCARAIQTLRMALATNNVSSLTIEKVRKMLSEAKKLLEEAREIALKDYLVPELKRASEKYLTSILASMKREIAALELAVNTLKKVNSAQANHVLKYLQALNATYRHLAEMLKHIEGTHSATTLIHEIHRAAATARISVLIGRSALLNTISATEKELKHVLEKIVNLSVHICGRYMHRAHAPPICEHVKHLHALPIHRGMFTPPALRNLIAVLRDLEMSAHQWRALALLCRRAVNIAEALQGLIALESGK